MKHTENVRKLDVYIKAVNHASVIETTYELLKRQTREMRASALEHPEPYRTTIWQAADSINDSARAVDKMVGMFTDREFQALKWREKRRLRKLGITQQMWEDDLTASRLRTGRDLIKQILGE